MIKVIFGIIGLAAVALVGGVFLAGDSSDEPAPSVTTTTNSSPAPPQPESDNATANGADTKDSVEVASAGSQGIQDYSPEALKASTTKNNLLFFHAAWCTVCNSVERNIEAGAIPDDLSIFKVDYDSDLGQKLAGEYKIPIQYSMVQVDNNGQELHQWVNNFNDGIDDITGNLL